MNKTDIDNLVKSIETAQAVIDDFRNNHVFDPYNFLTGNLSMHERYFAASVDFIHAIETAAAKYKDETTFKLFTFNGCRIDD